jgi:hypothetical protein
MLDDVSDGGYDPFRLVRPTRYAAGVPLRRLASVP